MGTSGNRDCQRASLSALKDFKDVQTICSGGAEADHVMTLYFGEGNLLEDQMNPGG